MGCGASSPARSATCTPAVASPTTERTHHVPHDNPTKKEAHCDAPLPKKKVFHSIIAINATNEHDRKRSSAAPPLSLPYSEAQPLFPNTDTRGEFSFSDDDDVAVPTLPHMPPKKIMSPSPLHSLTPPPPVTNLSSISFSQLEEQQPAAAAPISSPLLHASYRSMPEDQHTTIEQWRSNRCVALPFPWQQSCFFVLSSKRCGDRRFTTARRPAGAEQEPLRESGCTKAPSQHCSCHTTWNRPRDGERTW